MRVRNPQQQLEPAARRKARVDRKRLAILEAAAAVFRSNGVAGASTKDIADVLGMTPAHLYYYFRDKQDIIYYCQRTALDRLIAAARKISRMHIAPDEKLRRLIAEQIRCMLVDLRGSTAHIEFDGLAGRRLAEIMNRRGRYEALVRGLIRRGVASGIFAHGDERLRARAILGALNWTARWYSPDGPSSPEEIGREYAEYLVRGLLNHAPRRRKSA